MIFYIWCMERKPTNGGVFELWKSITFDLREIWKNRKYVKYSSGSKLFDGRNFWPIRIFYGRRIFYMRNTRKSRFLGFFTFWRVGWWDLRIGDAPWVWKDSKVSFPWSQNHLADFRPVIEISIGRWWWYEKKWPKIPKKVDFFNFLKNHPEGI